MMNDLIEILTRIEQRLADVQLSASAASRAAGKPEAIRNLKRAVVNGGRRGITTGTLSALAPVLKTSTAWLMTGEGSPDHLDVQSQLANLANAIPSDRVEAAFASLFHRYLLALGLPDETAEATAPEAAALLVQVLTNPPSPALGVSIDQMVSVEVDRLARGFVQKTR